MPSSTAGDAKGRTAISGASGAAGNGAGSAMPTSRKARCLAALALVLFWTWLLNRFNFPLYDNYLMSLRDISSIASGVVFILVAFIATRTLAPFRSRGFIATAIAGPVIAAALLALGVAIDSAPIVVIAALICSISGGMVTVVLPIMFLDASLEDAGAIIAVAAAIALALQLLMNSLAPSIGLGVSMAVRIIVPLIVFVGAGGFSGIRDEAHVRDSLVSVQDAQLVKPSSFLPFSSQVFVCMFIFQAMFGVALTYNEVGRVPVGAEWELMFVAPAVAYICIQALRRKEFDPDLMFRLAFLLVLAGFLVIPVSAMLPSAAANTLIYAGFDFFNIVSWYVFIAIGSRNRIGAIATFSWGAAMKFVGVVIGANLGRALNADVSTSFPREVFLAVFILMFVAYMTYFVSHKRFINVIHSITPVEDVVTHGIVASMASEAAGSRDGAAGSRDGAAGSQGGAADSQYGTAGSQGGAAGAPDGAAVSQDGAHPPVSTAAPADAYASQNDWDASMFHEGCQKVASKFGLTSRESDVFELLARGRNGHFIQESLTVSYNTVKTHVLHIYTKLGIHSQQELIDMVEDELEAVR